MMNSRRFLMDPLPNALPNALSGALPDALFAALRIALLSTFLLWAPLAFAQVPAEMPFQGLLLDDVGAPITGAVDLDFELFDDLIAGTSLWSESQQGVMVVDGVYSVTLGANTPIASGVVASGLAFLAITVEGELLTPRQQLLSVPYALRAAEADNVGSVSSVFIEKMVESFPFDGSPPGNLDPSEGTGDIDGDGLPNFVDPDNDNDGIPDGAEVVAGTSINLITPAITDVSTAGPLISYLPHVLTVTGANFDTLTSVTFGPETLLPTLQTSTGFEITVTPDEASPTLSVQVTLANGETTNSLALPIVNEAPVITSVSPPFIEVGTAGDLIIYGSGFVPGVTVQLGGQTLTPTAVAATSLNVAYGPEPVGAVQLVVFHPNGLDSGPRVYQVSDPSGVRIAFVTAGVYSGNLGGLSGADALCQAEADAAAFPGTYMAWLSDTTGSPSTRFNQQGSFIRADATPIAFSWADLVDGSIAVPLNLQPNGNVPPSPVSTWTSTDGDGTARTNGINSCQNWTVSDTSGTPIGLINNVTDWSVVPGLFQTCNGSIRLYCFQQ